MRTIIILSFLTIAIISKSYSQEDKFKALFVYNFTKLIEWPANTINNSFIIGVIDNDNLCNELNIILKNKNISGYPIKIKNLGSVNESKDCQIIIFNPSKKDNMINILSQHANQPVLLVSDKSGACKEGAAISFSDKNGNLNFEISRSNLASHSLIASSKLFELGTEVE